MNLKNGIMKVKNALDSPDRNEKPSKSWRSAITGFVMYSGKYVLKKLTCSAPKKE